MTGSSNKRYSGILVWTTGLLLSATLSGGALFMAPDLRNALMAALPADYLHTASAQDSIGVSPGQLEKKIRLMKAEYDKLTPRNRYIIVNTADNRFTIMEGKEQVHQGVCSTGSYVLLKSADKREWLFATPRGQLKVLHKSVRPVWRKPDWAFIEEGLPVPPPNAPERWESGVLGNYALSLGDGYLIHGTLYKRQLGMPVTHGCIRLGDEDLEIVYQSLPLGSKVYIY